MDPTPTKPSASAAAAPAASTSSAADPFAFPSHPTTPELHPLDLPLLTPSKPSSFSGSDSEDSESSSIFDQEDSAAASGSEPADARLSLASLNLGGEGDGAGLERDGRDEIEPLQSPFTSAGGQGGDDDVSTRGMRTPDSSTTTATVMSRSEPPPAGGRHFRTRRRGAGDPGRSRKRSVTELVALRWGGGRGDGEVDEEERGRLALDLGTYINSGDPDLDDQAAPRAPLGPLKPRLPLQPLPLPPPRSRLDRRGLPVLTAAAPPLAQLPLRPGFGGKGSRGFIPGPGVRVEGVMPRSPASTPPGSRPKAARTAPS